MVIILISQTRKLRHTYPRLHGWLVLVLRLRNQIVRLQSLHSKHCFVMSLILKGPERKYKTISLIFYLNNLFYDVTDSDSKHPS